MLQYGLLAMFVVATSAAYSSSTTGGTGAGAGAGAGSFAGSFGNAGGGGFGSGFGAGGAYGNNVNSGGGGYGDKYPYPNGPFFGASTSAGNNNVPPQQFPFVQPPFNFGPQQPLYNTFAQDFWKQFGANLQNAATMTWSTPGANAYAFASSAPNDYSQYLYKQQLAHQAALFNQFGQGQAGAAAGANYGGAGGGGFGGAPGNGAAGAGGFYAPNFAGSSAAYGPGGFQQSATIIPANPNSPNVDTRFGGDQPTVTVSGGPPGFHGVSTSSFSSSSDINGQKTSHREAATSVNDNGRVTTYHVRS